MFFPANNRLTAAASTLVLVVGLMIVPQQAAAQHGSDSIRQYIERTEELLVWAQGLVAETESDPARRVLGQAAELHQRSQALFGRGMMLESLSVARRARDAMWHAVRVAREAMGLEERIAIRAERFRDQHGQLMERARDAHNKQALDFLDRARVQAGRARDIYHQGDFKLAWKLLEQAENLMRRAARLLADSAGPERLERELERTRELLGHTRDRLGSGATASQGKLLAEAEEALQRALKARDQGQPGRALQMAGLAANLAQRAGRNDERGDAAEAIQRQLDRFAVRAERVGEQVRDSGSKPARKMLRRALDQRDQAVTAQQGGEGERALRLLRAAHDFLDQAADLSRM